MPPAPRKSSTPRSPRLLVAAREDTVRLSFIPVVDCAPLLVAREHGLFVRHGLKVELSCEVGWATIREKLFNGEIEAAHAVAGLSVAMPMGLHGPPCEVVAGFVFNLHGDAITLSQDLWHRGVRDATTLHKLIRSTPQRMLTFGTVSRFSFHYFLLRRWLLSARIDPTRDVRIVVLPPTQMSTTLEAGLIDGYCVGEPWNSAAVAGGTGWCVATSEQVLPGHPEKVLLARQDFAVERSDQHAALIRAFDEACALCDRPEFRPDLAKLLAASGQFGVSEEVLRCSLVGPFDAGVGHSQPVGRFHIFHREGANVPDAAKAQLLACEMQNHGLTPPGTASAVAARVWREDLYRAALEPTGSSPSVAAASLRHGAPILA